MSVAGISPRAAASVSADVSIRRSELRAQTASPTSATNAGAIRTTYVSRKLSKP